MLQKRKTIIVFCRENNYTYQTGAHITVKFYARAQLRLAVCGTGAATQVTQLSVGTIVSN